MSTSERSLQVWINYANSVGLQCHQITQLDDGTWRVSMKVFGASHHMKRNPVWTDYAIASTPAEAFEKVFASERFRAAWEPEAKEAVALRRQRRLEELL